jgi:hypothetical protein
MKNNTFIMILSILLLPLVSMGIADIPKKHNREKVARQEINNLLLTIQYGFQIVDHIVDVDSFLNDMRFYKEPLEDPYGTLQDCFIFTTDLREETVLAMPDDFNQTFGENFIGSSIGVYKDHNILWLSEPVIAQVSGRLFTTRDINNDGNVDILTVWGFNNEEIWIYSWDGNTGYRINAIKDYNFSVIEGMEGLFHLFDANGDGILEIKNTEYENMADIWSWNGTLYGKWPDTSHLPETTMWPRNNFEPEINCSVTLNNDSLYYQYSIKNKPASKQRINTINIQVRAANYSSIFPAGWINFERSYYNLRGWRTKIFDQSGLIWPGKSKNGYAFISKGLPVIAKYFTQADNDLPNSTQMSNKEYLRYIRTDLIENTVKGFTISPADPPDPFSATAFSDSLIQYCVMSDSLTWITDSIATEKYKGYFENAKSHIQQNNNSAAINVLDSVLTDVDVDSGVTLTSEAYALIKYNTEYLKDRLTQSHGTPHNVRLLNSQGQLLAGGSLQYYDGGWKTAVNNCDGTFLVETERSTVSLRMSYEGGNETRQNVSILGAVVDFKTVNSKVELHNSQNQLMPAPMGDEGSVQYYAGGWRDFGVTAGGIASKELLPLQYSFRMTYAYASIDKQQNIGQDSVVVFQTVAAKVELHNSAGNLMPAPMGDQGTVQYYAGAWREFGTTSGGVASKELLPKQYSFRMAYAYASIDMQQDIGSDPTVVFQTVNAQVELRNSTGNLIDQGTVQYYAGAWREFGTTSGGVASLELLPKQYSFRMSYAFASIDKQQDISTDPVVSFATVLAAINVTGQQNQALNGAQVSYYSGAWRTIGETVNGSITRQLLPRNYTFRAAYQGTSADLQQDISQNSTVNIQLNITGP